MLHWCIATGEAIVRLTPQGNTGTAEVCLREHGVRCLAGDPHHPEILYAGSRGSGVWKSDDCGGHWRRLAFPEPDVFSLAVSAADGAVYAGTEPSRLYVSRDGGASWRELAALQEIPSRPTWRYPPRPSTSHVRWVAPSPHDPLLLLVGIELGGVMRSDDGGVSWSDHRPGAQKDVHTLAWHPAVAGRAYQAGGGGAAWSRDAGRTWTAADDGRDRHYTWALAVDPQDPDCWYISACPGPRQAHGSGNAHASIYRWRGGGPWQPLGGGLPQPLESFPYVLASRERALFAGLGDGRIYYSPDQGDHWHQLTIEGDPLPAVLAMVCSG